MRPVIYILAAMLFVAFAAWKLCYPRGAAPTAAPNLPAQWNDLVYSLDENEAERFVVPPYPTARQTNFGHFKGVPLPPNSIQQFAFPASGLTSTPLASSQAGTLGSAAFWCIGIKQLQLDVPRELLQIPVDGDWIINRDLPVERRHQALQSILRSVTKRDLIIERKMLERDVIVARGNWSFVPMEPQPPGQTIWLQFYTDALDRMKATYVAPKNITALLELLEDKVNRTVIDEAKQRPTTVVPCMIHLSTNRAVRNEEAMDQLLENLAKQTSLEFVRTKRMIPIWFVREKGTDHSPVKFP